MPTSRCHILVFEERLTAPGFCNLTYALAFLALATAIILFRMVASTTKNAL